MKNRKNQLIYVFFLVMIMLSASCKTTQKKESQVDAKENVSKSSAKKVSFRFYEPKVEMANMKVAIRLNGDGRNLSSSATLKIKRDSLIQICISPVMGIEVVRMEVSPKDVMILNKIQGKFYQSDLSYLSKFFGVKLSYHNLQSLLLNQLFLVGDNLKSTECLRRLNVEENEKGVLLTGTTEAGVSHQFNVEKNGSLTNTQVTVKNLMLTCVYNDFFEKNGMKFPYATSVKVLQGKTTGNLDIIVKTAEFNKSVKFNVTNKQKYVRVDSPNNLFEF